jgi:type IV fimbrial biogenesis protein FimT
MALLQRSAGLAAGFTLIELSVVLALSATLLVLAVPSFQAMVAKRKVQHAAQALAEDLRFARAEAIKRSRRVEVCKTNDGMACNPALAGGWANGWLVMTGPDVLRVQTPQQGLASSSTLAKITYEATGLAARDAGNITFEALGASALVQRLCVSMQGRVRLAPFGATEC